MRIISAAVTNFASYKELAFTFTNKGLALISGPTGSGKSTLCDIIPWVLFGHTAKDGSADEVRSWDTEEEETSGDLSLKIGSYLWTVHRSRGLKNDLWFSNEIQMFRGKDLLDTQKLLDQALGVSYETYLAGAYFHEFSQTASFFIANAKTRRAILEQVVDLNLAVSLTDKLKSKRAEAKAGLSETIQALQIQQTKLDAIKIQLKTEKQRELDWTVNYKAKRRDLQQKARNFQEEKEVNLTQLRLQWGHKKLQLQAELEAVISDIIPNSASYFGDKRLKIESKLASLGNGKCETCGSLRDGSERLLWTKKQYELIREQQVNENRELQISTIEERILVQQAALDEALRVEELRLNPYDAQLTELLAVSNPHTKWAQELEYQLELSTEEVSTLLYNIDIQTMQLSDIELLQQVVEDFRGALVKNTVTQLEDITNARLSAHFDAEVRVEFAVEGKDKIGVLIYKDGNECSYTQLSKGQRQILKLCFGTSVMKSVQEYNAVGFNCVFLDEALDGLDDNFKTKAYGLLQQLALDHESVFVVEHNETLKTMFPTKIEVSLVNGASSIEET